MNSDDNLLLFPQYTYPDSHRQPLVPSRPFVIHSDELEKCVCETHSTGRKCPYHAVLSINPDKRSEAMKAVVDSHDLVIEAGKLLLSTRAHTLDEDLNRLMKLKGAAESSADGAVLEKAALKLIKACVLHRGVSEHIALAPMAEFNLRINYIGLDEGFEPLKKGESAKQRAHGLSWLHLVISVPLVMWQMKIKLDCKTAIVTASIALALLAEEGRDWGPLLERHGLTMWDVELTLRMHQTQAVKYVQRKKLPRTEKQKYRRLFIDNVTCVCKREPSHPYNVNAFTEFCNGELACQLLRVVIEKADQRGDHYIASLARWHLCYIILVGGEGQLVPVAKVLNLVKEAQTAIEQGMSWGAISENDRGHAPGSYWQCLGFAARCKAAIKADPNFAQSMVYAYDTREAIDAEKRHVMCAQCKELCDKLQKCGACELVDYCSKKCQVKHWKAGHKLACTAQKAPAQREQ